ncbi:MAG: hypothetical protein WCT04_26670 [Planctomycetota bacterium]
MIRWSVLIVAFALWLGSLALVYQHCKPIKVEGAETASQMALLRMFSENEVENRLWTIFVDPNDLEAAQKMFAGGGAVQTQPKSDHVKIEWNGLNENALTKVGRLETRVKNKQATSLDEETTLRLDLPGTGVFADYKGTTHLTLDNGIENCSMKMKLGLPGFEFDALGIGTREGDNLLLTTNVSQKNQVLMNDKRVAKIGGNTALNTELVPFQFNPDVLTGFEWTIVMLDMNLGMGGDTQGPKPIRVKCTGNTTIWMNGSAVRAFSVRSLDGTARAWYSPDGTVLKQTFRFAGVLDVVLVRNTK